MMASLEKMRRGMKNLEVSKEARSLVLSVFNSATYRAEVALALSPSESYTGFFRPGDWRGVVSPSFKYHVKSCSKEVRGKYLFSLQRNYGGVETKKVEGYQTRNHYHPGDFDVLALVALPVRMVGWFVAGLTRCPRPLRIDSGGSLLFSASELAHFTYESMVQSLYELAQVRAMGVDEAVAKLEVRSTHISLDEAWRDPYNEGLFCGRVGATVVYSRDGENWFLDTGCKRPAGRVL